MSTHSDELRALLHTYEEALNTSDAALAASCYAADGVFMPAALPTAAGDQMQAAYGQVFAAIRLRVTFSVDELVVTSDRSAYALTRSHGEQTVLATGSTTAEANRELFIFHRGAEGWRIARYMFNKVA
jgi:uncharacterized protein (TIGR02246 family)